MGCILNGPGESKQADIGISLPGTGNLRRAGLHRRHPRRFREAGELVKEKHVERWGNQYSPDTP
jgi:(E)-4-hydroxy-3-methylbut-2-enyl-diphosphate synthase